MYVCVIISGVVARELGEKTHLDETIAGALVKLKKPDSKEEGGGKSKIKKESRDTKRKRDKHGEGSSMSRVKRQAQDKCVVPNCRLLDEKPISSTAVPCGLFCYLIYSLKIDSP